MKAGVPQGTKVGPVVFLAMINIAGDSRTATVIDCFKYVDDLPFIEKRSLHIESCMPDVLEQLHNWSVENGICLNPKKCAIVDICFAQTNHSLLICH